MVNETEDIREKRRAYQREWYAKNKDKCKMYTMKYWERKAQEFKENQKQEEK